MPRTDQIPIPEKVFDTSTKPLRLDFECTRCERRFSRQVEWACISPEHASKKGGWDGLLLSDIVECPACGAVDEYRVTPQSGITLIGNGLSDPAERGWGGRVQFSESRLWDGTIAQRPSQALERLRELTREQPENGEAFRRLGNACKRWGSMDEAVSAWRQACEVDDAEIEAAYSLAHFLLGPGERVAEGFGYLWRAIRALPESMRSDALPHEIARAIIGLLAHVAARAENPIALMATWSEGEIGGSYSVAVSSVDVEKVENFDRLADLVCAGFFIGLELTPELPDEEPTILQRLLADDDRRDTASEGPGNELRGSPRLPARRGTAVGRNAPCPCGSGRKYKRCCGRKS